MRFQKIILLFHPKSCLSATSWTAACQASLSFTISQSLRKLNLCHPFSCCLQSFQASGYFSNESALCIKWPKYWTFSFSISLSNKYSGLISFRIDWFDLLEVQGTLKSLLQQHNLKLLILWHSSFLMVQHSQPYMATGKKHSFDYMDLCWQSNVFAF